MLTRRPPRLGKIASLGSQIQYKKRIYWSHLIGSILIHETVNCFIQHHGALYCTSTIYFYEALYKVRNILSTHFAAKLTHGTRMLAV